MRNTLRCMVALSLMAQDGNAGNPQKKFKGPVSVESGGGVQQRWTEEKANAWYNKQPWIVGCNFLPSTAVNDVEMWQAETFDPKTIDRELGMAEELGFNSVRVFLNYVVWKADPDAIFMKMLEGYRDGNFQNGIGNGGDWKEWDGRPNGYEGLLVDAYYPLTAWITGRLGRGVQIP